MSRLLVKIKRDNWSKSKRLEVGDVPGDCLQDLRIKDNELSAWCIEPDDSNLRRVMTALAATNERITTLDFIIFDDTVITTLGLKIKVTSGNTPDREANHWHRDLVELSGKKALALIVAIFDEARRERFFEPDVESSLREAITLGHIDSSNLNRLLASKLTLEAIKPPSTEMFSNPIAVPKAGNSAPPPSAQTAKAKGPPDRTKKKEKPRGFVNMCIEIVSFSRASWRRYRNGKLSQRKAP